jgi:heme-degrading monooxygenase HmoA
MYTATFIFAKKQLDEDFYALDARIAQVAQTIKGYLGEESWENTQTGRVSTVYYWDSLEALQQLMHHPAHLEAKSKQAQWLNGYRVEISQVMRSYGDDLLSGPYPLSLIP